MRLRLTVLPGALAVCRLGAGEPVPDWVPWRAVPATGPALVSVTRSGDELSVVCAAAAVPDGVTGLRDWRAFVVEGPLDFALTGVLAGLTAPLATAGISIFAVSTYDTDYLLVRSGDLAAAVEVLGRTCEVTET